MVAQRLGNLNKNMEKYAAPPPLASSLSYFHISVSSNELKTMQCIEKLPTSVSQKIAWRYKISIPTFSIFDYDKFQLISENSTFFLHP